MKKLFFYGLLTFTFFLSSAVFADYRAQCLDAKGEWRRCRVDFSGNEAHIRLGFPNQTLSLSAESITKIHIVDQETTPNLQGLGFFVPGIASLSVPLTNEDEKAVYFGILYYGSGGSKNGIVIQTKRKMALGMQTQWEALAGDKMER